MKIGLSFGTCIRDIVQGKVPLDDVLMIITATMFSDVIAMEQVVDYYLNEAWYGLDKTKVMDVARALYTGGRIHQPRIYGAVRRTINDEYAWLDVLPTNPENHPSVREAWDQYQMVLRLVTNEMCEVETQDSVLKNSQSRVYINHR